MIRHRCRISHPTAKLKKHEASANEICAQNSGVDCHKRKNNTFTHQGWASMEGLAPTSPSPIFECQCVQQNDHYFSMKTGDEEHLGHVCLHTFVRTCNPSSLTVYFNVFASYFVMKLPRFERLSTNLSLPLNATNGSENTHCSS